MPLPRAARGRGDDEHPRRRIAEGQAGGRGRGHDAGRIDRRADRARHLLDHPLHVVDQGQASQRAKTLGLAGSSPLKRVPGSTFSGTRGGRPRTASAKA